MDTVRSRHMLVSALVAGLVLVTSAPFASATPVDGTVGLLTTPPELTTSVDPNIVVTFDDSGSMASNFMGDNRPFDNQGWGNNWFCAGTIDPRVTDKTNLRSASMNGVYYNPNVTYTPPIKADGTSMPNADATLKAVWKDGIQKNRPRNAANPGTTNFLATTHWSCGNGTADPVGGGPYYFRLKTGVGIGTRSAPNTTALYTASNWEAVSVPTSEYQNWANWWAYYRTRNLMTRTALSRVFGGLSSNVRVAWQNINDGNFKLPGTAIITSLLDSAGCTASGVDPLGEQSNASSTCYRSAFFNWVFATGASGSTPDRASTIRAGNFFKRGNTANVLDPYWQPPNGSLGATSGRELSCRQNFHMLVTDGYWNEGDPALPTPYRNSESSVTLPTPANPDTPAKTFSVSAPESRVFWDVQGSLYNSSLANIAFNYWATDLRPDLPNNVVPYIPDKTTGVTGSTPFNPGATPPANIPLNNDEIYYNPANDPATWQHVVQFMVTLGVAGNLVYPDDLIKLRTGVANASGAIGWPRPINNDPAAIDDTWHAAVNSRGSYFSAGNPGELVQHLAEIITSVLARGASSTPVSLSLPLVVGGTTGYSAGYDSTDWSGSLISEIVDKDTGLAAGNAMWDAGCLLTGGAFDGASKKCTAPSPVPTSAPTRAIVTANLDATGAPGVPFVWGGSLGTTATNGLNQDPSKPDQCNPSGSALQIAACDGYGSQRVAYLRGSRTNETTGIPLLRKRGSLLGAVINAKPLYVSSPRGGYEDAFPTSSPEQAAFVAGNGYAAYQDAQRSRTPMVYVGSNDGMLHAFDAKTGAESWAFVPGTLIQNRRLARSTAPLAGLTPGVDSAPREGDVFLGGWKTVLVGSLRFGGRGIYAIDVTNVSGSPTETNVAGKILWEFNSGTTKSTATDAECGAGVSTCASLGYTYDSANIARIHDGNKWVALVSSGYFPDRAEDGANPGDATEPAAKRTSLLVIDLATGKLIKELRTTAYTGAKPAGFTTFGLSTPVVYDKGNDQVDDVAYAGDLAGNLWRFDISDADPSNWKVDLMFTTYGGGAAAGAAVAAGDQPIQFNPTAMTDPVTKDPIVIFGTGKYIGRDDRTSAIPQQLFYGIRDYGTCARIGNGGCSVNPRVAPYPIQNDQLVTQVLTQGALAGDGSATRSITGWIAPTATIIPTPPNMTLGTVDGSGNPTTINVPANGWRLPLNITGEPGERAERRAFPLYTEGAAVLYTLIPKSDDPCSPGKRYALMAVSAGTGATVFGGGSGNAPGTGVAGVVTDSPYPPGDPARKPGGGANSLIIPGLPAGIQTDFNKSITPAPWHRGAWRELLDLQ